MDSVLGLVMLGALAAGAGLSVFAWAALRRDRRRADIRIERLRQLAAEPAREIVIDAPVTPPSPMETMMFAAQGARTPNWGATVLVVVVFMGIGAGTVYGLYGAPLTAVWPGSTSRASRAPVELVSLSHRRESDTFVVTGLVHNPDDSSATPPLSAVIYAFDGQGQFLTSAQSVLETGRVQPGDLAPFTVRLAGSGTTARYRVSFRADDGTVYPHADRRSAGISGTTVATVEGAR